MIVDFELALQLSTLNYCMLPKEQCWKGFEKFMQSMYMYVYDEIRFVNFNWFIYENYCGTSLIWY